MPQQISPDIIGKSEKFLLYGHPGVGKTHCALTLPPPIYYICTGGPDEVQTFYSKTFQAKHKLREQDLLIDSVDLTFSWKLGKADGFDQIKKMIEEAIRMEQAGEINFNSIALDNITTLTELQIEKAILLADMSKSPEAQAKGDSTKKKFDETGVLQVADYEWKDVMNMMAKFLSELFVIKKNFCIVAHEWEQVVTDRKTKKAEVTAIKPLFIGKQRDLIPNLFSNVWRIYPTGQISAARTIAGTSPSVIAKTRIGGILSPDYPDPNLSDVISKFKKHAEEQSEKSLKENS